MASEPRPDRIEPADVVGFNSEVLYRTNNFHVQTENLGKPDEPTINTLIFLRGTLIHKISTSYEPPSDPDQQVKALQEHVKSQHTTAITRVKSGEFSPKT